MSDIKIQFLRVLGTRAQHPTVLAIADGTYAVRWNPKEDWSCTCDELEFPACLAVSTRSGTTMTA